MNTRWDGKAWAVLILAAVVLLAGLGTRGLNEPDEGRFAEIAREMASQSNWTMPHLGGIPHLHKPPLVYWLTALSLRTFGINTWAARLPSALAAWGTVALLLHLAGLLFGARVRWKAGLVLLSSLLFFVLARLITTDMLLTFWITGAVTAFVHYTVVRKPVAALLFYSCLGLGFLTKGPMAFLVPLCAVIPWAIAHGRSHDAPAWRWHWWVGLPLALAIGFSWFLILFRQYPQLLDYFIRYEFVDRIASNVHKRSEPIWFYATILLGGLMPWTFLWPRILRATWQRLRQPLTPTVWLFAGWLILPLAILHLVTSKLPTYVLPLFPPLALALAQGWHHARCDGRTEIRWLSALFSGATVVALLLLGRSHGPIIPDSTLTLTPGLLAGGLVVVAGWAGLHLLTWRAASRSILFAGVGMMMLGTTLLLFSQADHALHGGNASMRPIAEAVRAEEAVHGPATVFACNIQAYGLDFYLQRLIHRTVVKASRVLPAPPETAGYVVDDADRFLKKQVGHLLVLIKRNRLHTDPRFAGWSIAGQSGSMVLVRRPYEAQP